MIHEKHPKTYYPKSIPYSNTMHALTLPNALPVSLPVPRPFIKFCDVAGTCLYMWKFSIKEIEQVKQGGVYMLIKLVIALFIVIMLSDIKEF